MIEIVFGDSACGGLKIAQRYGAGKYRGGCVGIALSREDESKPTKREVRAAQREAQERMRQEWENAVPMGGDPADVYGFNLALSVGDISEEWPGIKRKQVLEQLFSGYPEGSQAAREMFQRADENLQTVLGRAAAGEALRIWYSDQPDEMCGLYWFMDQLDRRKANDGQVFIVKLPEWEKDENGNILRRTGWGEVAAGEWHRYLELQRPAPPVFIQSCAFHWRELQRENAPLRATLNGQLASVPEKFYDDFICREIAAEAGEFQEARIIGRVLGKYQLGVSDSWLALRIEEMIRAGKLEAVSSPAEDEPAYHRMLKKCAY